MGVMRAIEPTVEGARSFGGTCPAPRNHERAVLMLMKILLMRCRLSLVVMTIIRPLPLSRPVPVDERHGTSSTLPHDLWARSGRYCCS